ncbi:MAG: hypothetical protein WA208_18590 [Thermoanaerobaculia bacterium]
MIRLNLRRVLTLDVKSPTPLELASLAVVLAFVAIVAALAF